MSEREIQLAEKFVEHTIQCDLCSKKLLNYAIIAPDEPVTHVLAISCPFCKKGESEHVEIKGLMSLGPIGKDQSANPTQMGEIDLDENNVWHIKVEKA